MHHRNNNSAINDHLFVTQSILELLSSNRIIEMSCPSFVVSPLSVAYQDSGKKRLILDLSRLNKFVLEAKFKLEDWKIGLQYITENALLFSFDLKSGYQHIDISAEDQKYLGFSRDSKVVLDILSLLSFHLGFHLIMVVCLCMPM